MQEEDELTPQESLELIQSMISKAKNSIADNSFYFIFWGWLVFIAAITQYITILLNYDWGRKVWYLIPLGALTTAVYGYTKRKNEKVKTHIEHSFNYLWGGFAIVLTIALSMTPLFGAKATCFFAMLLYGLGTFVSGGILNFKPLLIGSFFSFASGIASAFTAEKEELLWISVSLLFSYIIPGHLLKIKFKSQQNV